MTAPRTTAPSPTTQPTAAPPATTTSMAVPPTAVPPATTPPTAVPHRPRVLPGLPVLRRTADVLQIGADPRHGVVLGEVGRGLFDVLLDLRGERTTAELGERLVPSGEREDLLDVLGALAGRGLVEEAVPHRHERLVPEATTWALRRRRPAAGLAEARAGLAVVVRGDGRLAVAVASLLAAAGVGRVQVVARGVVAAGDVGGGYRAADVGRPRGEAAWEAVRRAEPSVRGGVVTGRPDLVVLADALVPPPEVLHALLLEGTPHLVARAREGLGLVGPLVVPGRSSCVRCGDLRKAEEDGDWPDLLAQLVDRPQLADLATTEATAGVAAAQALLALDEEELTSGRPPTWDHVLEVDAYGGALTRVPAPPHPRCYCHTRTPDGRGPFGGPE